MTDQQSAVECPCPNCPSPSDCDGRAEVERLREALREIVDGKTALPHEQVAAAALFPKKKL